MVSSPHYSLMVGDSFLGVPVSNQKSLYNPDYEHDACGVGFVADTSGRRSHPIVEKAIEDIINLRPMPRPGTALAL